MSLGRSFAAAYRADNVKVFTKFCLTNATVILQFVEAFAAAADSSSI